MSTSKTDIPNFTVELSIRNADTEASIDQLMLVDNVTTDQRSIQLNMTNMSSSKASVSPGRFMI